jgi:hypothetical protein
LNRVVESYSRNKCRGLVMNLPLDQKNLSYTEERPTQQTPIIGNYP